MGYKPEKMSDDEFLLNKNLLNKIKEYSESKETHNTRVEGKNLIKRDMIY